jgi:putative zinc finger protein
MKALTCAATRRRLQPFHDRELAFTDQIAVSAHLEWCDHCAASLAEMRAVRTALHALAPGRVPLPQEEAEVFTTTVVSRLKAEDDASLFSRVRAMFEDMRLGYAGLGAVAATAVCVVIMVSMMRFATGEQKPDSLAAIMNVLATPLECESGNDLTDASGCRARWAERFQRANEWAEQDAVFTLETVVTQHGRLDSLAVLRAARHAAARDEVQVIEALLEVVSRSRLDRTGSTRLPLSANNMLWLVEHATVRATKQPALDVPLPPKKRAAALNDHTRLIRV